MPPRARRVRWYYYTFPLEALEDPKVSKPLAAKLASGIPPKASVLPFAAEESRVLEEAFRANPAVLHGHRTPHAAPPGDQASWDAREEQPSEPGTGCPKVCVRGGLYDASLGRREMESGYWPGCTHVVVRGTWFCNASDKAPRKEKWVPLREDLAAALSASGTSGR